jgi:hypothetical protein
MRPRFLFGRVRFKPLFPKSQKLSDLWGLSAERILEGGTWGSVPNQSCCQSVKP